VRQRNRPLIKHSENPTPKQDSWWATELILEPVNNMQLKLLYSIEGGADQAAPLKDRRKRKKKNTTQPPGKITSELLLKYRHQD
jgi:hypothetical protein